MVPFTLARPSRAPFVIADSEMLEPQKRRVGRFFEERGIQVTSEKPATPTINHTSEATSTQTSPPTGGDSDERTDNNIDGWD